MMYESTQEETSLRDAIELGVDDSELAMTPAKLNEFANWCEERQKELALSLGYDPFGGQTVDEFLATVPSLELVA